MTRQFAIIGVIILVMACKQEKVISKISSTSKGDSVLFKVPAQKLDPGIQSQSVFDFSGYNMKISRVVRKIFEDSRGTLWLGTEEGAYRFKGETLQFISGIKSASGQDVTIKDITEDFEGNIWFATTGGIAKFDGDFVTNYYKTHGLLSDDAWCISADCKGNIWIGTSSGVCVFREGLFKTFTLPEGVPDVTRGITSAKMVHCIMEDSTGNIWFGTNGGAYVFNGIELKRFNTDNGLCDNFINTIIEDKGGFIWFGTTHNGFCKFDGNTFEYFTDVTAEDLEVWDMMADKKGNIWISTKGVGVFLYNGKQFKKYNIADGLESPGIMSLYEDTLGHFWFGGTNGLFRLKGNTFVKVYKNGPW